MKNVLSFYSLYVLIIISFFITCSAPAVSDGTSTGNSVVTGRVYIQDGTLLKPVENATVNLIQSDANPDTAKDVTVYTDQYGFYEVSKMSLILLKAYNVFAEKHGKKGYKKEALNITDLQTNDTVPPILLDITGSLTGVVLLMAPHTNDQAIILLTGTNLYFKPDTTGRFILDSLAEGDYPLHIIAEPDGYAPYDTVISIKAGVNDTLKDTIRLLYTRVPVVIGFTLSYDSITMTASLSWDKSTSTVVKGYYLYRAKKGKFPTLLDWRVITDTFYTDMLDTCTVGDTLQYTITAVDSAQNQSFCSPKLTCTFTSVFCLYDSIQTGNYTMSFLKGFIDTDTLLHLLSSYPYNSIYRYNKKGDLLPSININFGGQCHNIGQQVDKYGNIYLLLDTNSSKYLRKYSNTLTLVNEVPCDSMYDERTTFIVNPEGYVFFKGKSKMRGNTTIYRLSPSLNLEKEWENNNYLLEPVQATRDTIIMYSRLNATDDLIVEYYNFDFNLLKTTNVTDIIKKQGLNIGELYSFILLKNGFSAFLGSYPKLFVLNSDNKIYASLQFRTLTSFCIDSDLNIYTIEGTILNIYKMKS